MAFYSGSKTNQNLVFGDKGEIGNSSFAYSEAATIASTLNTITPSDSAAGDSFGISVAVGCGKIVAGAWRDDDNGSDSGSAYIFDLDGTNETKITASDGDADDSFGYSVAIGCGRIVVGAIGDNSSQGAAYIFDLDGNQLTKITASDGAASNRFGNQVAIGNDRIVVGAYLDDNNGSSSGSAYIFDLDGTQLAKITASDGAASDYFGQSVAVGNGRIVVGAPFDDDNGTSSGSAYIFDLDGNQLAKITASDGAANDEFGYSVAVGSGRIVVSSRLDYSDIVPSRFGTGSVYVFDLDGTQLNKITASNDIYNNQFGGSGLSISNGKIFVSARYGVNASDDSGSVYIYDLDGTNEIQLTRSSTESFTGSVDVGNGKMVLGASNPYQINVYNINEYYDDYVEKIADNRIGQYTRLTG